MKLNDKVMALLSTLALIVSVVVLCIGEDARSIYRVAELSLAKEYVDLKKLGGGPGYVGFAKVENFGGAASEKLKLIFSFEGAVPKYDVSSDEDVGSVVVKDKDIRVSLDRLSSNSSLKVAMQSSIPFSYVVKFVDDEGGGEINSSVNAKAISLINVISLFVMVVSLLVLVRVFKHASENNLKMLLEQHQDSIRDGFREIKDEIGNIEIVVSDVGVVGDTVPVAKSKGVAQRLSEFMGKIP